MCICCCVTRKTLLIYSIIISIITIIFGSLVISNFGSKADVYKILKEMIDSYETNKSIYSSRLQRSHNINSIYEEFVGNDAQTLYRLSLLKAKDFEKYSYTLIKRLKGIENGLGTMLFIFPIIFLGVEIAYLVFVCGIGENQLLKTKTYNILYYIKIITYTLSILFIFISLAYSVLLLGTTIQYRRFTHMVDSCVMGTMYGMYFGFYGFWYYSTLSCIFGRERQLFIDVGSQTTPGIKAIYDVNGNIIIRAAVIPNQQIFQLNPYMVPQLMNAPYQQVQVFNRNSQSVPMDQKSLEPINQPRNQSNQSNPSTNQQQIIQEEQIPQNQNATSGRSISNRQNNANNQ